MASNRQPYGEYQTPYISIEFVEKMAEDYAVHSGLNLANLTWKAGNWRLWWQVIELPMKCGPHTAYFYHWLVMSHLQNWGRFLLVWCQRCAPFETCSCPFKPSYASHNLYIPLPLEIKVDWFDFFDEVLEQVRAGDWQALTEALAEPASPMKWFFNITTYLYYYFLFYF